MFLHLLRAGFITERVLQSILGMKYPFIAVLLVCTSFLAGCKQREIHVYTAPKDAPVAVQGESQTTQLPQWKVPSHWIPQPSTPFRLASFTIPSGSQSADLSISFLNGQAGGLLANINRWRGQIQLMPITQDMLPQHTATLAFPNGKAQIVDMTSADGQTRMLVAIWEHPEGAWFFKLMGPTAVIASEEKVFSTFLESVVWP